MKLRTTGYRCYFKPAIDRFAAVVLLLLAAPLLAVVAFAVRIGLGSPVLFVQERIGLRERPFRLYKFRTMTDARDAEGDLLPDEKRLTKFGRWLRRTSLDELPELWNVFRGEMSFVGPRPLLTDYLPLYSPQEARRHAVKPGLTGLAQVNGRNTLSWDQKFALDRQYVDQLSLRLDLLILCKTVVCVARRKGIGTATDGPMPRFKGSSPATSQHSAEAA